MNHPTIWLCDLTYNQQSVANDTVPAAIGGIAAAILQEHQGARIKLFKFPDELINALTTLAHSYLQPDIISFSNYSWNINISLSLCKKVKTINQDIITVSGGPNFPFDKNEQFVFLKSNPWLDIYIQKEGELAWKELVSVWYQVDCITQFHSLLYSISNIAFIDSDDSLYTSDIQRIRNLEHLPSPYLVGILDDFLNGTFLPVIQTNRGCPFTCSFCTEGQRVWSLVKRKPLSLVCSELYYIAEKLSQLPANRRRHDLLIADSNFGMYPEDLEVCEAISTIQKQYGWPTYINVATGKNNKERVLEASQIVKGAINLAGSVQSLDPTVQKYIKRDNISTDQILQLAQSARSLGADSYSELILGLPGETKDSHIQSINTLVDSGFNYVVMYQLMLLPGTEMSSPDFIKQHEMKTAFRIIPRAFGRYSFNNETLYSFETEEIVVQTSTLTFEDYLDCRLYALCVNIFYNNSVFDEALSLLRLLEIQPSTWINDIFTSLKDVDHASPCDNDSFAQFKRLAINFIHDTKSELWSDSQDLIEYHSNEETFEQLLSGVIGSNLIYKYKALSITTCLESVKEVARVSFERVLSRSLSNTLCDLPSHLTNLLSTSLFLHAYYRMTGIFSHTHESRKPFVVEFPFNLLKLLDILSSMNHPSFIRFCSSFTLAPQSIRYFHHPDQVDQLESYLTQFGTDENGLSRILTRIFLRQYFRQFESPSSSNFFPNTEAPRPKSIDKRLHES